MSRMTSAAQIKGHKTRKPLQIPKEGTIRRAIWDRLKSNPNRPVTLEDILGDGGLRKSSIEALRDYYGLDIIVHKKGGPGTRSTYKLIGEYQGRYYIDFTQEVDPDK